jgi:hypothetical protein
LPRDQARGEAQVNGDRIDARLMERIGADVRRELSRFGAQAGMAELLRAWPAAVGSDNAYNAWPARFQRDGTLVVHTADSVWAFELGQLEATIRERLGDLAPRRIRFVPGPLPEFSPPAGDRSSTAPVPSPEAVAEASRLTSQIADEGLRKLVQRAVAAALARASSGRAF